MDGVLPAVPAGEGPELSGILFRKRPDDVWVEEFTVDDPLPTRSAKIPSPGLHRGSSGGERQQWLVGKHIAIVWDSLTHSELDEIGGSDDLAGGATAIELLQAVLQIDLVPTLGRGEVHDHIHTLGHAQPNTLAREGCGQEIPIVGELGERLAIAQEQLIHTRWATV